MARPSPTVRRRRLRAELRRLRAERGLTIEDVQELSGGRFRQRVLEVRIGDRPRLNPLLLQALADLTQFLKPHEGLVCEKHVDLFPVKKAGLSAAEAFANQTTRVSTLKDCAAHAVDASHIDRVFDRARFGQRCW